MWGRRITARELLARPEESLIIDLRGGDDEDPAIPGSRQIYLVTLLERLDEFQERLDSLRKGRPVVLYCRNGHGGEMLLGKIARRNPVQNLQGGMVSYLELITRLLAEHPYEDPSRREITMQRLLAALTDRHTSFRAFHNISSRLLQFSK